MRSTLDDRAYEIACIIQLVRKEVLAISSDDNIMEVDEKSSGWAYALEGAIRLCNELANCMQQEARPTPPTEAAPGSCATRAGSIW